MDAELIAYLDQRFTDLRTSLRQDFRADLAATEERLRAEALATEERLRAEIAATEDRVRVEALATAEGLRTDIAATEDRLRVEISADTTRHIDVIVEALMSKMELVVEGVRTVDRRLDRFSDEVRGDFEKVDRRLLRLHARIGTRRRRRPGH